MNILRLKKNSGDFSQYHSKIMQFDWCLSVLEQKQLENHEVYYKGAAECWVSLEISLLRTSLRMEVPLGRLKYYVLEDFLKSHINQLVVI